MNPERMRWLSREPGACELVYTRENGEEVFAAKETEEACLRLMESALSVLAQWDRRNAAPRATNGK